MVFTRFVQVGRVALINAGPCEGKLAVIVDVIDQNSALVANPCTGVKRQAVNFRQLSLTDFTINVGLNAGPAKLTKEWEAAEISSKWEATPWAKKLAQRKRRATLTDFERFQVMVARKQRSKIVHTELKKLKKTAK